MAKQNFIGGGYYGKLGDTVGQRWKNKRTIRSYVIPKNPRTDVQQANRARFKNLVPYAQLGMSANKGATVFIKENMTEWQARMSACSYFNSLGYNELDLVPLYPADYVAPYVVSIIKRTNKEKDSFQYFDVVGTLPSGTRSVTVLAKYVQGAEKPSEVFLFEGVFEQNEDYNLKVSIPAGLKLTEDTKVRIISRDDVDSTTDMIASAMVNVQKPDIVYIDFDTSVMAITHEGATYSIITNQNFAEGTVVATGITIKSVVRGQWQTYALTGVSIVNNAGKAKIVGELSNYDENNIPAFAGGSQVYFGDISISSPSYVISASDVTENYSDEDLTRSASVTFEKDAGTTLAIGALFSFGESGTSAVLTAGVECTLAYNAPSLSVENATVAASVADTGNGTMTIKSTKTNADYHCIQGCSLVIPAFTIKVLGVTYNISGGTIANYTNNAEKVAVTFNTAISSVSHSGTTYTIKTAQKWLDGNISVASVAVKSVIRGQWQTYSLTGTSIANNGGYVTITGELSNYDANNIPAFASGSSINLGAISLVTDVYNITAGASTNSYNDTDLTRSASVTFEKDAGTTLAIGALFSFGESGTSAVLTAGVECTLAYNAPSLSVENATVAASVADTGNGTMTIKSTKTNADYHCIQGCSLVIPAFTIKVLGVTYNISGGTIANYTNNAEKVAVTFNTAISSVSHSGTTYTIKTAQKWLDGNISVASVAVKSVIRGQWQTYSLTGTSIANNGGYVTITGELSNYDANNIPAFASGSSINLGAISLVTDVYNIAASASTNSYNDTDLTRSAKVSYKVDGTTQNAFRLTFSFGGSNAMTVLSSNITCSLCSNRLGISDVYDDISAIINGLNSSTREITTTARAIDYICKVETYLRVPAFSVKVLGVTYNIGKANLRSIRNSAEYGLIQSSIFSIDEISASTGTSEEVVGSGELIFRNTEMIPANIYQEINGVRSRVIDCLAETAEGETVSTFTLETLADQTQSAGLEYQYSGTNEDTEQGLVYPIHVSEIDFVNNFLVIDFGGIEVKYKRTAKDELWIQSE